MPQAPQTYFAQSKTRHPEGDGLLSVLPRLNKHNVYLAYLPTREQSLRNANTYNLAAPS